MLPRPLKVIPALIVLGFSQPLVAGVVTLQDFAATDKRIDFAVLDSTPPAGPFSIGPVTFSESSTGTGSPGWRLSSTNLDDAEGQSLRDNAAISNIQVEFATAVSRAGLLVGIGPADYEVNFFSSGGALLGSVSGSVDSARASFFAGWEDQNGIGTIQIVETSAENPSVGAIADVRYSPVPLPGAWLMMSSAVSVLCGWQRRRCKQSNAV